MQSLKTAKAIQAVLALAALVYMDILVRFPAPPPLNLSAYALKSIAFALAVLGIGCLAYSHFLPGMMIKAYRGYRKGPRPSENRQVFSIFLARAAFFEAVALYDFFLGVLGASLKIVAPFLIAALVGLLLTFPTKSKWNRLATMDKPK